MVIYPIVCGLIVIHDYEAEQKCQRNKGSRGGAVLQLALSKKRLRRQQEYQGEAS